MSDYKLSDRLFKTLREFSDYVVAQGGCGSAVIDLEIAPQIQLSADCFQRIHWRLVPLFTASQLMTVSSAEQIINRALLDGMSRKKYYKDIYQDVKRKVILFVELHGTSDVVAEAMKELPE